MVGDPAGNYWTSFDSLFASAYAKARAVAPRRPVMIGEVGSSEDGGNKAQWINDMASTLQSGRYPDLKNVVYFDQDKEERWSGTSSSAVQTAFTSWVNQTYMRGTGTDLAKVAAEYKGTSPSPSPSASPSPSPSPSASPSPSPSPSASPSPGGGACSATYATVNSWPGGFQGEVTVRTGASGINGWTARWTLAGGQTISQLWNGTLSISGSEVTVKNVSWNGSLGANASATFGFLANGSPASPTLTCSSP